MKSIDKFGRPIFPYIFRKLEENGARLEEIEYSESQKKPNLFFKVYEDIVFFADMRGTNIIPIWMDPSALFYWQIKNENLPPWAINRKVKEEMRWLTSNGCKIRLSGFIEFGLDDHLSSGVERIGDGFCNFCDKDFQDEGLYCSNECEKLDKQFQEEQFKTHCSYCGKALNWKTMINHHVSYEPEKTVPICRSCHMKIIKSKKHAKR